MTNVSVTTSHRKGAEMDMRDETHIILIGLGANLPSRYGEPQQTLDAALSRLSEEGVRVLSRSRFWKTQPVPVSDQPWFVNAVASIETELMPPQLLALLHRLEAEFGRVRSVVNAPRLLDLDLLAYGRTILTAPDGPQVPHPRLAERAFVLLPIQDVAPGWIHPASGQTLAAMIAKIPPDQRAEPQP